MYGSGNTVGSAGNTGKPVILLGDPGGLGVRMMGDPGGLGVCMTGDPGGLGVHIMTGKPGEPGVTTGN